MLNIKEGILEKINTWNDNYYVLLDFDRTLTEGTSVSSWGVLAHIDGIPEEYGKEREELFNFYHPMENDLSMDFDTKNKYMVEWWSKHVGLFIKYKFTEDSILNDKNVDVMKSRKGADDFLRIMHEKNIPVIIISAGIGNFIEKFLVKNNLMYDNIHIVANTIKFENGVAVGISNNIIHALNKNEVSMPDDIKELVSDKENIVLLGDSINDIAMIGVDNKKDALKIGFINENIDTNLEAFTNIYDIVGINDATFNDLIDTLKIFK